MEDSYTARPIIGRLITLNILPTRPLTLLGPAWAVICGVIASGGIILRWQTLVTVLLVLLLCDTLLGAWRAMWLSANWRAAFRKSPGKPVWFSTEQARSQSLFRRVSDQITYIRKTLWPKIDSEIIGTLIIGALLLCIAVMLGQILFVITVIAMLCAMVEGLIGSARGASLRALIEIAAPWLIAQSAFTYFYWPSFIYVFLFTMTYRALLGMDAARPEKWVFLNNLAQLIVVILMIVNHCAIGAGAVALGLIAQVLWQARYRVDRDNRSYTQHIQSYILIAMLAVSLSLWL